MLIKLHITYGAHCILRITESHTANNEVCFKRITPAQLTQTTNHTDNTAKPNMCTLNFPQ